MRAAALNIGMKSAAAVNSIEDWFLRQLLEKAIESIRGSWESFSITTIELQEEGAE